MNLDKYYLRVCDKKEWGRNWPFPYDSAVTPEDIYEHLPFLKALATGLDHITEFGVRCGYSTLSWLTARPKVIRCYDVAPIDTGLHGIYCQWAHEQDIDFWFTQANDLNVEIDETDLLFIDTEHTAEQLDKELQKHGDKARKYIVMHDTTQAPALWNAITKFMNTRPHWRVRDNLANCNGLTVLERL